MRKAWLVLGPCMGILALVVMVSCDKGYSPPNSSYFSLKPSHDTTPITGLPIINAPKPVVADITSSINGSPVNGNTTGSTNLMSSGSAGVTGCLSNYGTNSPEDVYSFRKTGSLPVTYIFTTEGGITNFDTALYLMDNNGNILGCDDDSGAGTTSRLGMVLVTPGYYFIIVDGWNSGFGFYTLTVLTL